jgi:threonine synthase
LDIPIKNMFINKELNEKVNLISINSINWARIMIQTVHFFYSYLNSSFNKNDENTNDLIEISISVPTGIFLFLKIIEKGLLEMY